MTRLSLVLAAALALAACSGGQGGHGSTPPPSGNTPSGQPSGANGTPSGSAQT